MSVIIVGGGMVGTTLALALSELTNGSLPIDIVEMNTPGEHQGDGFDNRSLALAAGTCQRLEELGIWQYLSAQSQPIETIHISDKGHAGLVTLDAKAHHLPAFGHVVELQNVGQTLFSLITRQPNIRLHCPAKMVDVSRSEGGITIRLDNGEILCGKLAIAADGVHSSLGSQLGMTWVRKDYHQTAVIANVQMSAPKANWAFERFTSHGPLALLPTRHGRNSLVWCHKSDVSAEVLSWSDEKFKRYLLSEFGQRLGSIERVGQRQSYPLSLNYCERHVSHRLAMVGNAAQMLHPIAGQGFNLGFRDVATLATLIKQAIDKGEDIGDYALLAYYQQLRRKDQQQMIKLTNGLVNLFSDSQMVKAAVRNAGMMLMSHSSLMQRLLIDKTLGQYKR